MCVNRPFDRNRWIGPISLASISSYSCPLLPSPTQLIIYSVHNLPSSYWLLYFTIFFWLFVSEPNLHCSYLSLSLSFSLFLLLLQNNNRRRRRKRRIRKRKKNSDNSTQGASTISNRLGNCWHRFHHGSRNDRWHWSFFYIYISKNIHRFSSFWKQNKTQKKKQEKLSLAQTMSSLVAF